MGSCLSQAISLFPWLLKSPFTLAARAKLVLSTGVSG
jgi:hypothetical protein